MLYMIIAVLAFIGSLSLGGECGCKPVPDDEQTHDGGNEIITHKATKPFKVLKGSVEDVNGNPLSGVLVEVFDKPQWIVEGRNIDKTQKRIGACRTGKKGTFCFIDLSPGHYEVRSSKNAGFNPDHAYVVVDPDDAGASKEPLEITLKVGT